jgi:pyruvate formate lyase activating enzyme
MNIGGFQEISLLDYPRKMSAIIWTTGCNFRCPFCYNPDMVLNPSGHISPDDILLFLKKRIGKLDAVSISGGEPLLQKDITSFIDQIKSLGFLVKIDTNGSYPQKLKELLDTSLVNYVAMDVKASKDKDKYNKVTGTTVDLAQIEDSINLIRDSAPDYEFRTTIIPLYHKKEDLGEIATWLKGSKRYVLQQFKNNTPILSTTDNLMKVYSKEEMMELYQFVKFNFDECFIRGL